jgi:hypothetical protein
MKNNDDLNSDRKRKSLINTLFPTSIAEEKPKFIPAQAEDSKVSILTTTFQNTSVILNGLKPQKDTAETEHNATASLRALGSEIQKISNPNLNMRKSISSDSSREGLLKSEALSPSATPPVPRLSSTLKDMVKFAVPVLSWYRDSRDTLATVDPIYRMAAVAVTESEEQNTHSSTGQKQSKIQSQKETALEFWKQNDDLETISTDSSASERNSVDVARKSLNTNPIMSIEEEIQLLFELPQKEEYNTGPYFLISRTCLLVCGGYSDKRIYVCHFKEYIVLCCPSASYCD